MATISFQEVPLSTHGLEGLGAQCDCFIYDDVNRQFGVDDDDYLRWERRLKLLRPAVARIFLPVTDFNPTCDGRTYD